MRNAVMAVGVMWLVTCHMSVGAADGASALRLIPYPQEITVKSGSIPLGPARYELAGKGSETVRVAIGSLNSHLPKRGKSMAVRLGSIEEGYESRWLSPEERSFLDDSETSPEASILKIAPDGITVVGKGKWGMLYGVQTISQLAMNAAEQKRGSLPCLAIRDWPDMRWRCLSPTMTWYSGYNRLEGYDLCNWTLDEWKWLVDWSLLHKCNGWAMCMYGNWPFTLPGYEDTTLDVDSFYYDPKTGRQTPYRFVHKNIKREFLPQLIRYANERGIKIYAYIGKNTFNGTYGVRHPDAFAGGAAELVPFHPGVADYWDAFIKRIIEIGFDGFVFEDPEARHVPNQNETCYKTFWEPWADKYGFKSIAETNENDPPLGVQVEYYSWLFKTFDEMIQKHARELGKPLPEVYLISHVLLSRMVSESKDQAERDKWFAYIDEKQGRKVPFIILEADEAKYVSFLGRDRVASLGGRGGSCPCAMFRIASVNNAWTMASMGVDTAYERACQKHIYEAGGFGAMAYIFEWANNEAFGYIGSQYLWRNSGVPGIDNDSQTDFLYYAYRQHYGEKVGEMVARVLDQSSCVNDQMMLDGVYGAQWPATGPVLYRDYQFLAANADRSVEMARAAYRAYTGKEPDPNHPVYKQEAFRWNGFDARANKTFSAERLRLLYVSTRRSQKMCEAVLAYRKAQRLIADGAPAGEVIKCLDEAVAAAKENQRIYCINYDDDYDWTDGLCSRVLGQLESARKQYVASITPGCKTVQSWTLDKPGDMQGWQASGLSIPVNARRLLEIEMSSDRNGRLNVWSATKADIEREPKAGVPAYTLAFVRLRNTAVSSGEEPVTYRIAPAWDGVLDNLRIDPPAGATVKIKSIRIVELPEPATISVVALAKPAPESVKETADEPIHIPWEKLSDIVPKDRDAKRPGMYLSTDIGFDRRPDYYRLGVVFTVQAQETDGEWRTIFRRAIERRATGWEHWDIPLEIGSRKFRFMTDSYTRAMDRNAPNWKWAIWGQPRLIEISADGKRQTRYDFVQNIGDGKVFVRLDSDGREREFDGRGRDSTGATFAAMPGFGDAQCPDPAMPSIAAFTPHVGGQFGVTLAEFDVRP